MADSKEIKKQAEAARDLKTKLKKILDIQEISIVKFVIPLNYYQVKRIYVHQL